GRALVVRGGSRPHRPPGSGREPGAEQDARGSGSVRAGTPPGPSTTVPPALWGFGHQLLVVPIGRRAPLVGSSGAAFDLSEAVLALGDRGRGPSQQPLEFTSTRRPGLCGFPGVRTRRVGLPGVEARGLDG